MAKNITCAATFCEEVLLPGHADILHAGGGAYQHYCSRHWKIIGDRCSRRVESDQERAVQKTDAWIAECYPPAEQASS